MIWEMTCGAIDLRIASMQMRTMRNDRTAAGSGDEPHRDIRSRIAAVGVIPDGQVGEGRATTRYELLAAEQTAFGDSPFSAPKLALARARSRRRVAARCHPTPLTLFMRKISLDATQCYGDSSAYHSRVFKLFHSLERIRACRIKTRMVVRLFIPGVSQAGIALPHRPVDWSSIIFRDDCTWQPLQLGCKRSCGPGRMNQRSAIASSPQNSRDQLYLAATGIRHLLPGLWQDARVGREAGAGAGTTPCSSVMQSALPEHWCVFGLILFGVDGSRFDLPRTQSHETAYGVRRNKRGKKLKRNRRLKPRTAAHTKKANVPQMWLTLLWHVGTGLPWTWRNGPTGSSGYSIGGRCSRNSRRPR